MKNESFIRDPKVHRYYGLIPERVFEVALMTIEASRKFTTPVGVYTYTRLPLPYYAFGIRQQLLTDEQQVIMACPKKALADKIVTTSGVIFRSKKDVLSYLVENLRVDEISLKGINTHDIGSLLPNAPKKDGLLKRSNVYNQRAGHLRYASAITGLIIKCSDVCDILLLPDQPLLFTTDENWRL